MRSSIKLYVAFFNDWLMHATYNEDFSQKCNISENKDMKLLLESP